MRFPFQISILGIATWLCVATASPAEDLYQQIVWGNEEHTEAAFIPADVVASPPLDELPLTRSDLSDLTHLLDLYRDPPPNLELLWPHGVPECMQSGYPTVSTAPAPDAPSLEAEASRVDVVLIGRVIARVPGWYALLHTPASLAYIQISQPLAGSDLVSQNEVVAVPTSGARFEVAGVTLCFEPASDLFYRPQEGDEVLITGYKLPSDTTLITPHKIFRIENNNILPQPYTSISTREELPVEVLISAVSAARLGR